MVSQACNMENGLEREEWDPGCTRGRSAVWHMVDATTRQVANDLRVNKAEGEVGRCQGGGLGPVSALSEQERVSTGLGKNSSLVLVQSEVQGGHDQENKLQLFWMVNVRRRTRESLGPFWILMSQRVETISKEELLKSWRKVYQLPKSLDTRAQFLSTWQLAYGSSYSYM